MTSSIATSVRLLACAALLAVAVLFLAFALPSCSVLSDRAASADAELGLGK